MVKCPDYLSPMKRRLSVQVCEQGIVVKPTLHSRGEVSDLKPVLLTQRVNCFSYKKLKLNRSHGIIKSENLLFTWKIQDPEKRATTALGQGQGPWSDQALPSPQPRGTPFPMPLLQAVTHHQGVPRTAIRSSPASSQ